MHRLLCGYWRDGELIPAGSVLELTAEDLEILGDHAEAVETDTDAGAAEPDKSDPDCTLVFSAMESADPDREERGWWTKAGTPTVSELRRRGVEITPAVRDRLWGEHTPK